MILTPDIETGYALSMFSPQDLELLICGLPYLSFADLRRSTVYEGFQSDSQVYLVITKTFN